MGKSRRGFFIGKNRKTAVIAAVSAILIITAVVYGDVSSKQSEIKFINNMKTGSVDVMIELYEITENGEKLIRPDKIMGNRKISCVPRVTNLRAESYVRVKTDIKMDRDVPESLTPESIYGLNTDWIKRGEYFYYKRVMRPMESADIFAGIQIPEVWKEDTASGFTLQLTVDAIQATNFSPDFDSAAPWGKVQIQKSKETDNTVYRAAVPAVVNNMTFTSASGLESSTEDLFGNFRHFMAGNSFSDTLKMENKSEKPVRLSFCTETGSAIETQAEAESDMLLEQAHLEIYCDGEQLYHGSLNTVPLYRYVELTVLEPGKSKDFDFKITLPAGLENKYSVLTDQVIWKFKAEDQITQSGDYVSMPVTQTGDEKDFTIYFAVALLALMALILVVILGRRD